MFSLPISGMASSFHRLLPAAFLVLALLVCASTPVGAASVVVEGFGPLIHGDLAQARDEALAEARVRAVEQGAGVQVEARSELAQELMVMSETGTSSEGFISNEQILEEGMAGDGLYRVRIRADVSAGKARDGLRRLLQDDAIVLVLDEKGSGVPFFESYLTSQLASLGYARIIRAASAEPSLLSDIDLEALAIRHMADVVLVGHAEARDNSKLSEAMFSAHGSGSLKAFRAREGLVLASAQAQEVRGFGNTPGKARGSALQETVRVLAKDVLGSLARKKEQSVLVVISDLPAYADFKKCKAILSQMRWVSGVEAVRFESGTGVYQVKVGEDVELLAARLDQFSDLSVVQFDDERIQVHFKAR